MKIKILKLTTSELVIGKCEFNIDKKKYQLKEAVLINAIPSEMMGGQKGQTFVSFSPFVVGSKVDTIEIDKGHTICVVEPDKQMLEAYKKMFSPIEQPPEKGLVLPQ